MNTRTIQHYIIIYLFILSLPINCNKLETQVIVEGDSISANNNLNNNLKANGIKIYNYAIAGEDTDHLINKFKYFAYREADIFIVLIGMNDIRVKEWKSNYKQFQTN